MQNTGVVSSPTPNYAYTAMQKRPGYLSGILFLVIILALIGGSLYWLQAAAQTGIVQGYPAPKVHIQPLASGTILRLKNVTFSAQASGRDLTYRWDFGDAQTNFNANSTGAATSNYTGQSVLYAYNSNGSHTVTVYVKDGIGQTSSATYNINVLPPPPVAHFTYTISDYSYYSPGYVQFDFSASSADPSTSIQSYYIDYGDGQSDTLTYFYGSQYHSYSAAGTYKVTLTVTDGYNQQASFSDTVNITTQ